MQYMLRFACMMRYCKVLHLHPTDALLACETSLIEHDQQAPNPTLVFSVMLMTMASLVTHSRQGVPQLKGHVLLWTDSTDTAALLVTCLPNQPGLERTTLVKGQLTLWLCHAKCSRRIRLACNFSMRLPFMLNLLASPSVAVACMHPPT